MILGQNNNNNGRAMMYKIKSLEKYVINKRINYITL